MLISDFLGYFRMRSHTNRIVYHTQIDFVSDSFVIFVTDYNDHLLYPVTVKEYPQACYNSI